MFLRWVKTNIYPKIASAMRWYGQQQSSPLIGLDIDSTAIKLLKANSSESANKIENFSIVQLPEGAIVKDEIKNPAAVVTALKSLLAESNTTIKNVALAIPRSSVIIKNILINPRLTAAEIESRAWIEANRHFPDLVGDIYLDFTITGPAAQNPDELEMILVACRKEHINPYLDVLQQSGLTTKIVDVNSYALERALFTIAQKKSFKTIALLNLNLTVSTLIVVHDNTLIYAHDHSFDGQRLMTQTRGKKDSVDEETYATILKENLSAHLRHTMHFFYSSRPHINIQQLVLAGDCATIPGLDVFIQKETNIETIIAYPFADMEIAPGVDKEMLKQYEPSLMLCYGLAMSKPKNTG